MTLMCICRILFSFLLLISAHIQSVYADADFLDVRTSLNTDCSDESAGSRDKYFHEAIFHSHYDGRFAQQEVPEDERQHHLSSLMQTFLSTMSDIGAETWIMHGTLLGWWWNQKLLPWDTDIDVQVDEKTIAFLAKYYNMTEYHYKLPGVNQKRTYLLEINPNYAIRDQSDRLNMIDGRWVATDTGLFIDISTVRPDKRRRSAGIQGALMVKDKHHYVERDIFPLRDAIFEGVPVKIPFQYQDLLVEEYGAKALTVMEYAGHKFNQAKRIWEPFKYQGHTWPGWYGHSIRRPPSAGPP